eukprot:TRINITY_DN94928_c0_g1_i1.p1 TRINITY_DN94928_c0_g1~~TRINITY_DN94928_c0_g1_i1.p1  ORF type:complete len:283 (+),score=42.92 TRINITY_DN94928_c0_g1_i1:80-928(+)
MAQAIASKPMGSLWKCDLAMARMLRARRRESGAQRLLNEGFVGRWPLSFLAAPQGLGGSISRLLAKPTYPTNLCRPKFFLPYLTSKPVWPSNDAVSEVLTENWKDIRDEFRAVVAEEASADVNTKGLTATGSWQKVPLWSHGKPHEENLARCPVTAEVLSRLPLCKALGMAYFSQLAPGTAVKPHFGPTNARLRYHLGLDIPEGNVLLAVADGYYRWSEGRTLVFSDAFIHAVHHQEAQPRGVLVVDVYHPELKEDEIQLLEDLERVHRSFFPATYDKVIPH